MSKYAEMFVDPIHALQWLKEIQSGAREFPRDFDWYGFAEFSSARSFGSQADHALYGQHYDLDWATVAIIVYEMTEWKLLMGWKANDYHSTAMVIRAEMIQHFGFRLGDFVLDYNIITDWMTLYLTYPIEWAIEISKEYNVKRSRGLTTKSEDKAIKSLGEIKHNLSITRRLLAVPEIRLDEKIMQWLAIKDILP